ncbi:MAG TPA: hypothetical protein VK777_00325 [Reyranella sp.]|nr:hypothetical protein [Reyranella sp.]
MPKPTRYESVIPPMGGSPFSQQDLAVVSAYVRVIGRVGRH